MSVWARKNETLFFDGLKAKGAQVLGSEVMQNFVSTRQAQELLKYVIPCPNQMQILFLAEIQNYIICKFWWRKLINFIFYNKKNSVADDSHRKKA